MKSELLTQFDAVFREIGDTKPTTTAFSLHEEDSRLLDNLVSVLNAARPGGAKKVSRSGVIRYLIRQNAPAILKAWNSE